MRRCCSTDTDDAGYATWRGQCDRPPRVQHLTHDPRHELVDVGAGGCLSADLTFGLMALISSSCTHYVGPVIK